MTERRDHAPSMRRRAGRATARSMAVRIPMMMRVAERRCISIRGPVPCSPRRAASRSGSAKPPSRATTKRVVLMTEVPVGAAADGLEGARGAPAERVAAGRAAWAKEMGGGGAPRKPVERVGRAGKAPASVAAGGPTKGGASASERRTCAVEAERSEHAIGARPPEGAPCEAASATGATCPETAERGPPELTGIGADGRPGATAEIWGAKARSLRCSAPAES